MDGRITNPHNTAKQNTQLDYASSAYAESSKILGQALLRNEQVRDFALINQMAPPLLCRYGVGMKYGAHSDAAYLPTQPKPTRSDVSCTIFLADPASYDGGELTIHLGSRPIKVKGAQGSAVLYPSTTLHEVAPVTRGERLVAITFIESQIIDETRRYLLYNLKEVAALEGLNMAHENRVRLEHVYQSLHRLWST